MEPSVLTSIVAVGGVVVGSLLSALWQAVESRRRRAEAAETRAAAVAAELRAVRRVHYAKVLNAARASTNIYDADRLPDTHKSREQLDELMLLVEDLSLVAGNRVLAQATQVLDAVDQHWVIRSLIVDRTLQLQSAPEGGGSDTRLRGLHDDYQAAIVRALHEIESLLHVMRVELGPGLYDEKAVEKGSVARDVT